MIFSSYHIYICPVVACCMAVNLTVTVFRFLLADKGVTANRCDKCFAFIIKSIAGGVDDAKLDIAKVLDFLGTPDFTIKEKMRAVGEVCSPKMAKALLEKGVKKELVKKATDYPNGKVFKCPTDLAQYPKSIAQFYKNVEGSFGDALTSLFG